MIKTIHPPEAKRLLESGQGYVYVDVRTLAEFRAGHAPASKNVPVMLLDPASGQMRANEAFLSVMAANFAMDAKLILGCKSGGRSAAAAQWLEQAGFKDLSNMDGGFAGKTDPFGQVLEEGWATLGFPVRHDEDETSSYAALAARAGVS